MISIDEKLNITIICDGCGAKPDSKDLPPGELTWSKLLNYLKGQGWHIMGRKVDGCPACKGAKT